MMKFADILSQLLKNRVILPGMWYNAPLLLVGY